jgi:peptidoglycan/LPS O-acetylase OafA/YrhL
MRDRFIPLLACLTFLGYLNSSNPVFQRIVGPLWIFEDSLFLQLLTVFLIGACFGVYSKKIFLSYGLLICLFLIYFLSTYHAKLLSTIGISTLGLIPFIIAVKIPKGLFNYPIFTWDISYGFYLYSFPIQQLMMLTFPNANFRTLLLYSTLLTGIIAAFSFKLLEAPMIQFGKRKSINT